jgi:hypothetical protein
MVVEKNHIRLRRSHELQRLLSRSRFADDYHVGLALDRSAQSGTHDFVVIDHSDSERGLNGHVVAFYTPRAPLSRSTAESRQLADTAKCVFERHIRVLSVRTLIIFQEWGIKPHSTQETHRPIRWASGVPRSHEGIQ